MSHWRGWRRWARRFQFWTDRAFEEPAPNDAGKEWILLERARRLHACIELLSPVKRACVTLVDLEELPASRVAEILGCPEPTVRSRLRAARSELAAMLRRDPLFAVAIGVLALLAFTATDPVAPPRAMEPAVASAPAAEVERKEPAVPLVVTRACEACEPRLALGDRLGAGEHVHVPAGSTLVLGFAIEDGPDRTIAGPAEVSVDGAGPSVDARKAAEVPAPTVVAPPSRLPNADDPAGEWRAAQAALAAGDRSGAEAHLRRLAVMTSAPAHLRTRAQFSLAELELARGATLDARALLQPLAANADPELAADATFLLARAAATPPERASVYAAFLARRPPSPYRELAAVDEARALLDAGDRASARRIADELHSLPVPGVVRKKLEALERSLGGGSSN
jgi:hypothetical protein